MATTNIDSTRNYIDLDLNFMIHPIRKDINTHKAENAVINSVKNLILTNHFERPFQPEVGSNIRRMLFENVDVILAAQIEREIEETINNFEPRVQISSIIATPALDENGYRVIMEFFVINNPDPIKINFFLERIR
jgi:phage baseplate assembly protein W